MATTTPFYLWSVPTSSDLVKNGATAIETLGDSVDASLWNSGYGQAGKNKIINSDFFVWQRGTTFTNPATSAYTADRWQVSHDGTAATRTVSQQTFTPGTAPVAGYEGQYFYRYAVSVAGTSNTFQDFRYNQEDVRTFAGQTVTLSFWAKADAARVVTLLYRTDYGSGGSSAAQASVGSVTLGTSWARYSVSYAVPSVSGLTLGTSSKGSWIFRPPAATVQTIDIWGVQVEYGSYSTPFQTASGGSQQSELAMCQRYYQRQYPNATTAGLGTGFADGTTVALIKIPLKVTMRIAPTALEQSGTAADYGARIAGGTTVACNAVPTFFGATADEAYASFPFASGLTAGDGLFGRAAGTAAYLGWSAEL